MRRKGDGEGPGKSVFQIPVSPSEMLFGPDVDQTKLTRPVIVMLQGSMPSRRTSDGTDVDDIRIIGFNGNESAFSGTRKGTFPKRDGSVLTGTGNTDAGIVLLGRINPVRKLGIKIHPIKLGGALIVNA